MTVDKCAKEKEDMMRRTDEEWSTHLAYFDPARGQVRNPGMGIIGYVYSAFPQWYCRQNSEAEQARLPHLPPEQPDRETVRRMASLPEIDCLYIRCEWWEIQKKAGELCLPESWELMLEEAERHGKPWSFRIMNHSPHSERENSLPDFLQNKFEMVPYIPIDNKIMPPGPRYYPRYTDEYLKWWNEMTHLLGERFDKHPLLSFGDVSGFGHWGEFHHDDQHKFKTETDERISEVVESLINGHLDAFPATPAVLNLHAAEFESGLRAILENRCWLRKDSFGINTLATRLVQGMRNGNAMVWETIIVDNEKNGKDELEMVQRYLDIGCCYAGIGFNAWNALYVHKHYFPIYQRLEEKIGYRLRPSLVWRRQFMNGASEVVVGIVNDGCATPPGVVSLKARFSGGANFTYPMAVAQPAPGTMTQVSVTIPPEMNDSKTVTLSLEIRIKGKTHPVRWAISTPDGKPPSEITIPIQKPYDQRGSPVSGDWTMERIRKKGLTPLSDEKP